ncbi:MAG: YbgC/FadM family acyl-CoA thioesterase [Phenylobacterium sp.]
MRDPTPTAGWFEGGEHVLPVRVYFEDTDFSGVVYHGAYVRFFERGRSDALRLMGVHHAELAAAAEPVALTVTRMEVDFRRSARIDDALEVRSTYGALQGARLAVRQRILRGEDLIAEAGVQAACIDIRTGRARRPPPVLIRAFRPLAE